jgi:hypothetical protein
MIPGNHHRAAARRFRFGNRLFRLVARRVDHADESREHQLVFDALVDLAGRERVGGEIAVGDAQGA